MALAQNTVSGAPFKPDCPYGHAGYRQFVPNDIVRPTDLAQGRDIIDRIEDVRLRFGLGKKRFAEDADISYRRYAKWCAREAEPDRGSLLKIVARYPVTLDELLGVAEGQDPPYAAWHAFLETKEGRRMNADERRSMQMLRWLEGSEPEVWHYQNMLNVFQRAQKSSQ